MFFPSLNHYNHYNDYDYLNYWKGREYENQADMIALTKLLSLIRTKHQTLVDIGAGTGRASTIYKKYWKNIYLIDPSTTQLEVAKIFLADLKNVQFLIGTAQKIPLPNQTCDTAICIRTFHHIYDPQEVFTEIRRLLIPGGYFLFEIANKLHFKNRLLAYFQKKRDIFTDDPIRIGIPEENIIFVNHNPKTITRLLKKNNFEIVKILSVSNFRSPLLKKVVSLPVLIAYEDTFQNLLSIFWFGPSIYFLVRKKII